VAMTWAQECASAPDRTSGGAVEGLRSSFCMIQEGKPRMDTDARMARKELTWDGDMCGLSDNSLEFEPRVFEVQDQAHAQAGHLQVVHIFLDLIRDAVNRLGVMTTVEEAMRSGWKNPPTGLVEHIEPALLVAGNARSRNSSTKESS